MKKVVILSLTLILVLSIQAQTKTFDCGLFSLSYPSKYKNSTISNAKHMVLKLECDEETYLCASYWDYKIPEYVSIWDDEIYELYSHLKMQDAEVVSVEKSTINIESGIRKCLKIKTNTQTPIMDSNLKSKTILYLMIHKGFLINFVIGTSGKYRASSSTQKEDSMLKGLKFK